MAKKEVTASKEVKEVVKDEKKISNREKKEALKLEKKKEKERIAKTKKDFEDKIDKLVSDLKEVKKDTKTSKKEKKEKVKELKKNINELKKERKNVGKKPSESFLGDVIQELKLVRWPSRTEVVKYTIATIAFVLFFALFFEGIDILFAFITSIKGWLS